MGVRKFVAMTTNYFVSIPTSFSSCHSPRKHSHGPAERPFHEKVWVGHWIEASQATRFRASLQRSPPVLKEPKETDRGLQSFCVFRLRKNHG